MKIFIDARLYGLENAGVGRYLINLIEEIKKLGNEEKFVILLKKKYFNSLNLPNNWKKILADFGHYSFSEQLKLPGIISKENPDIVHFPHFNVPVFFRGNYVVTIHDMTMHRQGRVATKLPLPIYYAKRLPYKYSFRKAVIGSRKIIVPSKFVKRDLVDYFKVEKDKIEAIYEGMSEEFGSQNKSIPSVPVKYKLKGKKYFLYVGNAYPHKNLKRVVEAIKYLNEEKKLRVFFAVASSRDYFFNILKKEVERQNAKKYVRLLGFVPDEDLADLYKNSLAFIYPSFSEGFGLPGIEAMSAGTLVLASNISVFREIYKDNAMYFNPYDFSSIAKVVEQALSIKANERKKIIIKAQKFIQRYSWQKMAKQTLNVYKEALKPAQI